MVLKLSTKIALYAMADGRKLRGERTADSDSYHLVGGNSPPEAVRVPTFLAMVRGGFIKREPDSTFHRPTYLITPAGVELARRLRS